MGCLVCTVQSWLETRGVRILKAGLSLECFLNIEHLQSQLSELHKESLIAVLPFHKLALSYVCMFLVFAEFLTHLERISVCSAAFSACPEFDMVFSICLPK